MLSRWMRRVCLLGAVAAACWGFLRANAQAAVGANDGPGTFRLQLPVNEVVVTFHATDTHGLPVNDLKLEEIRLLDNGIAPRRVITFDPLIDRPVRAGILVDTSESMQRALAGDKAIAKRFAERLFRRRSDLAFVMDFGFASNFAQPWTGDRQLLSRGIENVRQGKMNPMGGTAIFDTIFRACFYGFGGIDPTATGNFILLFSDGEDNASHTSMDEALGACQRSNTVIYAFRVPSGQYSTGPKTLAELAAKTGGRVFLADDGEEAIWDDLKTIESEMRNQYRLVYAPVELKHDGSFHRIELQTPERVSRVEVRSGYYAPER
jgi:VWFA-related protein